MSAVLRLFVLMSVFFVIKSGAKLQRYIVKGKLLCADRPMDKVHVKLIDIDSPGYDDVMDEKFTLPDGTFYLDGETKETTTIDPVLKVYHNCPDDLPCQRRWKMVLPKKYIVQVKDTDPLNKTLAVGVFNLESHFFAEKRKCFTV